MSEAIAVRVDNKGRLTIPKAIRTETGVKPGDLFFLQPEGSVLHYSKAENPFDLLAEHALKEHREGKTRTLREFAKEHNIPLDE
ncbi:MAG: AbrB/MazE/SpoVT family DNA-binding domain-containing protein [Armatimonadetes bacterium]|nr:AbrB/MazE/SpoVT family DNA-binding domain-containing protein [Armatimonadota bacterium]